MSKKDAIRVTEGNAGPPNEAVMAGTREGITLIRERAVVEGYRILPDGDELKPELTDKEHTTRVSVSATLMGEAVIWLIQTEVDPQEHFASVLRLMAKNSKKIAAGLTGGGGQ